MRDLIVAIFASKSQNQHRIVMRFFEAKIRILKMGTLYPTLYKTDIFNSYYNNFSQDDVNKIRDLIKKSSSIELKQSFYSISVSDFVEIYKIFENTHCFLFERIKKTRSYVCGYFPIEKIQIKPMQEFSIARTDRLLSINYTEENKSQQIDTELPFQILSPRPELYILNESNIPLCSLKFRYGNMAIDAFTSEDVIFDTGVKYLRNRGEENKGIDSLSSLGFIRKEHKFQYKGKSSFLSVAEELLENGFSLFDTNNKSVKSSKSFSANISYGIDWFDVVLEHDGTKLASSVYEKINLYSKFFEFNGEKYLIPEPLQKQKDSIHLQNGKLVIQKDDWLSALEMSSDMDPKGLENFENLFNKETKVVFTKKQKEILRPYQVAGVKWLSKMRANGFGALLADDMGLGKTLQTIVFLSQSGINGTAFAVVPKSLLANWKNEINKFVPDLKVLIYHGAERKENTDFENYDIVLSTYATTMLDMDFLTKKKFSAVIFDEVQTIKNYKSKMYEAAFMLKADFKMALSGTPFENNILELWAVMRLLNPKIFAKRTFFTKSLNENNFDKIKSAIAPFMLQRTKKDVLKDLPEKTEEIIYCTMDDEMASTYSALHSKILDEISGATGHSAFMASSLILESLLKLRQFCCHPSLLPKGMLPVNLDSSAKFDVLKIKVQALVEQKEKVIIFSQFTSMLEIIRKWLVDKKIKTFYLDGSTNKRQDLVDEFEKSEDGVFLISLKAGGVGLNLVSCHYVFIYDPWWNPAAESQASDRVYRIGQKNNVFVYRLITKGTIEEKVLELKDKKQEIAATLFTGLKTEKLTAEDLMDLLR